MDKYYYIEYDKCLNKTRKKGYNDIIVLTKYRSQHDDFIHLIEACGDFRLKNGRSLDNLIDIFIGAIGRSNSNIFKCEIDMLRDYKQKLRNDKIKILING